jgi:hypothetical protein
MHVTSASFTIASGVTIAVTFLTCARSLFPLASLSTGWRAVHRWQPASRSTPHPFAYDETNEAHHVAQSR